MPLIRLKITPVNRGLPSRIGSAMLPRAVWISAFLGHYV